MKDVFQDIIWPAEPRNEIVVGMDADEYRAAPGLSPSDIKISVPELEGMNRTRGSAARLRAHLRGQLPKRANNAMALGTFYHEMVLEREKVVLLDDEKREELAEARRKRKTKDLIAQYSAKKFMCNFAEAKEFKEKHGRVPQGDEQAELIRARVERELGDDSGIHEQSQEYVEFIKSVSEQGVTLIDFSKPMHSLAYSMHKALFRAPENEESAEIIRSIDDRRRRVEVSIFTVVDIPVAEGLSIPVQLKGRPDLILAGDTLDDFKTAASVDIEDFSKMAIRSGYFLSLACYIKMLNSLKEHVSPDLVEFYSLGNKRKARLIAQETTAPFEAVNYEVPASHLHAGWHFAEKALVDVCRRYLAEQNGQLDAWKTHRSGPLDDPFYPIAVSNYISGHGGAEFGKSEDDF